MSNWSISSCWENVPQKVIEKQPIYEYPCRSCPSCLSINTSAIDNMIGSPLQCHNCGHYGFEQRIIGYRDVLVEK